MDIHCGEVPLPLGAKYSVGQMLGSESSLTQANSFVKQFGAMKPATQASAEGAGNMQKADEEFYDSAALGTDTSVANDGFKKVERKRRKRERKADSDGDLSLRNMKLEAMIQQLNKTIQQLLEQNQQLMKQLSQKDGGPQLPQDVSMMEEDNWAAEAAGGSAQQLSKPNVAPPAASTGTIPKRKATSANMKDDGNMASTSASTRKRVETNKTGHLNPATRSETGAEGVSKSKASPPVIKMYNVSIKEFSMKLKSELCHDLFSMSIINKNLVGLRLVKAEDHAKVKTILQREKISFYTFTPKHQKPCTLIIRGLSDTFDESDLLAYIQKRKINATVERIVKLPGDRWIIQLSSDSDIQAFKKMEFILNSKVKISNHKRQGLIQCRNCQRFGHISTNCRMPFRCVKCGQSHGPGNCSIPNKDANTEESLSTDPVTGGILRTKGQPVRCVNCDVDGHVASAKDCPKRVELEKKRLEKKTADKNARVAQTARAINAPLVSDVGASYANMTRNIPSSQPASAPVANQAMGMINADCKRLLGKDLFTCMQRMKAYAETHKRLKTDEEKTQGLFGLLASLVLYD